MKIIHVAGQFRNAAAVAAAAAATFFDPWPSNFDFTAGTRKGMLISYLLVTVLAEPATLLANHSRATRDRALVKSAATRSEIVRACSSAQLAFEHLAQVRDNFRNFGIKFISPFNFHSVTA